MARAITSDATDLYVVEHSFSLYQEERFILKVSLSTAAISTFLTATQTYEGACSCEVGTGALLAAGDYLYGSSGRDSSLRRYTKANAGFVAIAGTSTAGYADGTGTDAWFSSIAGIASDGTNLWVSDAGNYRLRKAASAGPLPSSQPSSATTTASVNPAAVSTFAGSGTAATTDGTGTSASFTQMGGTAVVSGFAYQATQGAIRKVNLATGQVTTLAGHPTAGGCVDSADPTRARFSTARDLATDGYYLYAIGAGCSPESVRRISIATGATSTVTTSIPSPNRLTFAAGSLYVSGSTEANGSQGDIFKLDPVTGVSSIFATVPHQGQTNNVATAITSDATDLYVVEDSWSAYSAQRFILRVSLANAAISTFAKTALVGGSTCPCDISNGALISAGSYLYNTFNSDRGLRRYAKSDAASAPIAGKFDAGYADGTGTDAWFSMITGMASDGTNLWVADSSNYRLRKAVQGKLPDAQGGPTRPFETLGALNLAEHSTQCHRADPINCATGNFWEEVTDLAVPGRGVPLRFARTYNSLAAAHDGPLGFGWTHSYAMSLADDRYTPGAKNVTQENGSQVSFTSGPNGWTAPTRVRATLVQNGDGTWTFTRNKRERFTFDAGGKLTKVADLNGYATTLAYTNGKLSAVTDPAGRKLTLTYGGNGKLALVADPGGRTVSFAYDASANLRDVTDVKGGNTHFTYDAGRLMLTVRDQRAHTVTNTYDSARRVLTQTDALGRKTTFAYTASGTTITDPKGNVTTEAYSDGMLTSLTRGTGTPDAATWTYAYDPATLGITSATDPNNHAVTRTFDAAGNLLSETDALGRTRSFTYDALNGVLSATDAKGVATTFTYDSAGNLLTVSRPLVGTSDTQRASFAYADAARPGDVTSTIDPNGKTTSFAYDDKGNLTRSTDPLGNATTHGYDTLGRRTSTVAPKGNLAGADPAQHTTAFSYDAAGALTSVTDPLGHKATRAYDAKGNLASVTDPDAHTTTFAYDAADQLTQVTRPDTTVLSYTYDAAGNRTSYKDAKANATTYAYDALGRLVGETDPLGRATTYGYDKAGNRTSLTDASGQKTTFAYDAADQLSSIAYSDGRTPGVSFAYDEVGRRISMADGTGTSTYAWDSLGRLTGSTNGAGQAVGYGYDLGDQLTRLTYPGGAKVNRAYDAAGRLESVTDWLANTTTFAYDANSNLVTQTYPNGTKATVGYDNADRLTSIAHARAGTDFAAFAYGRTNSGLLSSTTSTGVGANETYGYNALDQLTSVNAATYGYDAADNLITLASGATLSYDAANQATTLTEAGATTSFGYDARGNRTSRTRPSGPATTYGYDQANRLTAHGTTATYAYDGDGLRSSKTVSGTTRGFVWDVSGGLPLLLVDGDTAYVYGPGGQPLEQISASGAVVYYHADQLGSTRALTDSTGATVATATYDAYGNPTSSTGSVSNPFGYAGQYTDAESGMQYLRARYYDPATAQFITRDPLVSETAQPYSYAANSPLNATDPTGEVPIVLAAAWGIFEAGSTAYDVYTTAKTFADPCESGWEKAKMGGLALLGVVGPGGGYSTGLRAISHGGRAARGGSAAGRTIRLTDDGLNHAANRHTAFGPLSASKSVFFDGEDLSALVRGAERVAPIRQGNGNFAYVLDAGREMGVDRLTGLPTSRYTVITRPDGTLVTTFPGSPSRGR